MARLTGERQNRHPRDRAGRVSAAYRGTGPEPVRGDGPQSLDARGRRRRTRRTPSPARQLAAMSRYTRFAGWRLTGESRLTGRVFLRGRKSVSHERFSYLLRKVYMLSGTYLPVAALQSGRSGAMRMSGAARWPAHRRAVGAGRVPWLARAGGGHQEIQAGGHGFPVDGQFGSRSAVSLSLTVSAGRERKATAAPAAVLGPSGPALRSRLATGLTDGAVVTGWGRRLRRSRTCGPAPLPLSLPVITELVAAWLRNDFDRVDELSEVHRQLNVLLIQQAPALAAADVAMA